MVLLKSFLAFIKKENLFQPKDKLLIAVSGGVDSVVLCELCKQAGFDFSIAHCNFQLRGEESKRDEHFVKALAEKYSVPFFVKKFETEKYAQQNKLSIQVAARDLRYEWFNEIVSGEWAPSTGSGHHSPSMLSVSKEAIHYIFTAHHANDNIETLLMNFFKGTGINGLRGILSKNGKIIRPLLFATKQEIKNFAIENNLSLVEDSSNILDKYTRNFFRNQLIPSLQKVFPQVERNLIDNVERFRDIEILYQQSIISHKKKLLEQKGEEIHIPVLKLLKAQPLSTIIYEIIKDFGFTSHQTAEVIHLLQSESGRYIQSLSHKIIRNRKWLILSPNNSSVAQNILIEEKDKIIEFDNGKLKLTIEKLTSDSCQLSTDNLKAFTDADKITFPLLLRKWKQGDYFYPLGMNKKKKLSRFFIDQKMSLTEKENTWIIETYKKVIWIAGKRIDDRFKITPQTKNVIRFTLC
jgi:tRNA(Ile)-lysidine synthase